MKRGAGLVDAVHSSRFSDVRMVLDPSLVCHEAHGSAENTRSGAAAIAKVKSSTTGETPFSQCFELEPKWLEPKWLEPIYLYYIHIWTWSEFF